MKRGLRWTGADEVAWDLCVQCSGSMKLISVVEHSIGVQTEYENVVEAVSGRNRTGGGEQIISTRDPIINSGQSMLHS